MRTLVFAGRIVALLAVRASQSDDYPHVDTSWISCTVVPAETDGRRISDDVPESKRKKISSVIGLPKEIYHRNRLHVKKKKTHRCVSFPQTDMMTPPCRRFRRYSSFSAIALDVLCLLSWETAKLRL